MLGWFCDVRPDEPEAELDADGPPGVLRPAAAALFSAPGTLRLPSRSGEKQEFNIFYFPDVRVGLKNTKTHQ